MKAKILDHPPMHYWLNEVDHRPTLVLLHPAFGDHTCFDQQIADFNDYQWLTLDLIGHGLSMGKGDLALSASYLKQILQKEKIEKIHLVGISIGAVLAQDFANLYPDMLTSLTCIGGYGINNFSPEYQKDSGGQQIKMMAKGMVSMKWFAQENRKISAYTQEAQDKFYQLNLNFKKSSFRYLASLGKLVNQHTTPQRPYPLLIGVGEYDAPMVIKANHAWHHSEPASQYVVIGQAGHLANMDNPVKFNQGLREFIEQAELACSFSLV